MMYFETLVLLQFVAAIHVSYNPSGTTILRSDAVDENALVLDKVGTDVWVRKSRMAREVQPLNVLSPMLVTPFGITTDARE